MLTKQFNRGICNLIKTSSLTSTSKLNSRNYTFLSMDHLTSKNKICQSDETTINPFISHKKFSFSNSRYNFSTSVESQVKEKEIQQVFDDIVAQAKEKYQANGQYNLLFLINQSRHIYPRVQLSKIQDLVILSKTLLAKAQNVKETIQKIENPTERKEQLENLLAQLSYWILLRIYVSSVALKRVCLNINSLETIQPNADVKKSSLQLNYPQAVNKDVFFQIENSLAEFDSFKLKYKDSQVHIKIQQYITQGLEEFSLCRKNNLTKQERQKIRANPKYFKLEEFKEKESHFLHQMSTLREAILKTDVQKVTQMYLANSVLIIMSDGKFQDRQQNYLLNSLHRFKQLSRLQTDNYVKKVRKQTKSENLTSQNLDHIQATFLNGRLVQKVVIFMLKTLAVANNKLESVQGQRKTESTYDMVVSIIGLLLKLALVLGICAVGIVVTFGRVKAAFNNDSSKKSSSWWN